MDFGVILITLGKLLELVPLGCCAKYHLCWWEGKLQCLPRDHTDKSHKVFRNITDADARVGFNSRQWIALGGKVESFLKENNL